MYIEYIYFLKIFRFVQSMCFRPRLGLRRITKQVQKWLNRQQYPMSTASVVVQYHEEPDKSDGDSKLYRALTLSNGLRAMLISDSYIDEPSIHRASRESLNSSTENFNGKLAACAVLVGVGSFSEPQQYQGLAHFVEHMIFMGSEKFPVENEFDSFVTKSGGFSNAHTENEETCFYFELDQTHLDRGMDLFMNLMKAPLMLPDAMSRERSAVQSEFEQTHMRDEVRRDQILASLASEGYPHGTFSWGNYKTLKEGVDDSSLHKELHKFYRDHYGSNRMVVALQAQLSLDELEELLVRHCADIPTSQQNSIDVSQLNYQKAFRDQFYKDVFLVQPVEDVCKLELTWVLPPMKNFYRSKPDMFISQLIGYEGVGSLCAYLRHHLWCISVVAGVAESSFDSNSIYSLFNICIYLSDDGFDHIDEVLEATFAWVKLIINSDQLQDSYKESQQIENNNFRFQIEPPPIDHVQSIVESFNYLPSKDVLTGPQLYFQYEESAIELLRQHMNKFNFNIMISSYIPYEKNEYDQREPWFGTQFKTISMPPKWQTMWEQSATIKELHYPQPNPFVTTDFKIHWVESGKPHVSRSPKALIRNDLCELWFRQDNIFKLPDGYINLYFITPLVRESVKQYMLGVLFTYLVEFRMAEQLYPALEAGLTYGLYIGDKGLVMRVSGYNEKLPLLVEIILNMMQTIELDIGQVNAFKDLKKRQIYNALINGKSLNLDLRLSILENKRFSMISKYESVDDITMDDIKSFKENFHKKMYVKGLIQGNFTEDQATDLMQKVLDTYKSEKLDNLSALDNHLLQIPLGSYYLRAKTLNEDDSNTIITNYYQIGPSDLKMECIMDLVELIVEEPFFNQLRTQEQLGYSLGIHQRIGYGVLAFLITINTQETKHRADYVEQRIEAFRSRMAELVSQMSDTEFKNIRETLINGKKLGDTSLDEEVLRNWSEIVTKEYFFNRIETQIQMLSHLTKEDVLNFLNDNDKNNLRKLSVQVVGNHNQTSNSTAQASRSGSLSDLLDDVQDNMANETDSAKPMTDKIRLEFLGESDDPSSIKDIYAFKKDLYVFPLFNTNPNLANKS